MLLHRWHWNFPKLISHGNTDVSKDVCDLRSFNLSDVSANKTQKIGKATFKRATAILFQFKQEPCQSLNSPSGCNKWNPAFLELDVSNASRVSDFATTHRVPVPGTNSSLFFSPPGNPSRYWRPIERCSSYAHLMNNFVLFLSVARVDWTACGVRYKGATGPGLAANPYR